VAWAHSLPDGKGTGVRLVSRNGALPACWTEQAAATQRSPGPSLLGNGGAVGTTPPGEKYTQLRKLANQSTEDEPKV
jgi:hypothetical protein